MKKICSLLVLLLAVLTSNAQIINIPDANFKAALLASAAGSPIASTGPEGNYQYFKIDANNDGEIQISEALMVTRLNVTGNNITSLAGIENFSNLYYFSCYNNHVSNLDLSVLPNLKYGNCGYNQLTSLNISGLNNLESLDCSINQLIALDASNFPVLKYLNCVGNQLTTLNLTNTPLLDNLNCGSNHLSNYDFNALTSLTNLGCTNNQISDLNVSNLVNLQVLSCGVNQLTSLDVSHCIHLSSLYCGSNHISSLDTNALTELSFIDCTNNQMTSLFIKNGRNQNLNMSGNPNIYICADEGDFVDCNCVINSYCSFTPGGTFYTIQGATRFDGNANGCDNSDSSGSNQRFTISSANAVGSLIGNTSGNYSIPVQAGTHTITPVFENPGYFTVSPATVTVTFPSNASPRTQNFCLTANGTHNDLEVSIFPLDNARPGFDAEYKIIYKNKGTSTQSGTVSFDYYDPIEDFVSATPNFTSQATNTLNWSFSNLNPFESREILVTFNLNSPLETPALNAGNLITYAATISGTTDETPSDNISNLTQTIVNSFDPNDKTCVEGALLPDYEVGKYLHYIIRFENTGTANAENVVVKDIIDTTKLDINTLIPLSGSHTFETKISSTNKVEFIFQNINLPFDDANNDGYVAFKIKSHPTLVPGNVINNSASIYFDYNAPIVTATNSVTVFNPLLSNEFEFNSIYSLSPVPAKNYLTITVKQDVAISSVSIYNTLGQVVQVSTNPSETVDVSGLTSGSYFIKIISDKGTASAKFVKE
ncbi:DUF7619 domain-containing protein [Flavobacterium sp. 25HG05S-40]|uniref:DUF7619 domain-containing protein n=1 Tax=Flavobacterium sp. 25HG05S-40 TaxID=3458682 RepID=UPI004044201E